MLSRLSDRPVLGRPRLTTRLFALWLAAGGAALGMAGCSCSDSYASLTTAGDADDDDAPGGTGLDETDGATDGSGSDSTGGTGDTAGPATDTGDDDTDTETGTGTGNDTGATGATDSADTGTATDTGGTSAYTFPFAKSLFVELAATGTTSGVPVALATGDLDGDSRSEAIIGFESPLAGTNVWIASTSIPKSDNPTLSPPPTRLAAPPYVHALALADWAGDDRLDILVGLRPPAPAGFAESPATAQAQSCLDDAPATAATIHVAIQGADGGFAPFAPIDGTGSFGVADLVARDIDGDGQTDLFWADTRCHTVTHATPAGRGLTLPRLGTRPTSLALLAPTPAAVAADNPGLVRRPDWELGVVHEQATAPSTVEPYRQINPPVPGADPQATVGFVSLTADVLDGSADDVTLLDNVTVGWLPAPSRSGASFIGASDLAALPDPALANQLVFPGAALGEWVAAAYWSGQAVAFGAALDTPTRLAAPQGTPVAVAVGQFDADGLPDVLLGFVPATGAATPGGLWASLSVPYNPVSLPFGGAGRAIDTGTVASALVMRLARLNDDPLDDLWLVDLNDPLGPVLVGLVSIAR